MRLRHLLAALAVLGVACETGFTVEQPEGSVATTDDAGSGAVLDDGGVCDPRAKFLKVDRLTVSTSGVFDGRPTLTADELSIYFQQQNALVSAPRTNLGADFVTPAEIGALHTFAQAHALSAPAVKPDGGTLIFSAELDAGDLDLYGATFGGDPFALAAVNSPVIDRGASFSADGAKLYFSSSRNGPFATDEDLDSIFVAAIGADGGFANPAPIHDATTQSGLLVGYNPTPSADGKNLYFARRQTDGTDHIFVADLAADGLSIANATALQAVDNGVFGDPTKNQFPGMISTDQCRLYFASDTLGDNDIYVARR